MDDKKIEVHSEKCVCYVCSVVKRYNNCDNIGCLLSLSDACRDLRSKIKSDTLNELSHAIEVRLSKIKA